MKHPLRSVAILFIAYGASLLIIALLVISVRHATPERLSVQRRMIGEYLHPIAINEFDTPVDEFRTTGKSIFVLQHPKHTITELDTAGEVLHRYHYPAANTKEKSFATFHADSGGLRVIDLRAGTFSGMSFPQDTSFRLLTRMPKAVNRAGFFSNGNICFKTDVQWNKDQHFSTFKLLDYKNNYSKEITGMLPPVEYNGIIYDGFFISAAGFTYYVNYYYNEIFCIHADGRIKYQVKTIDQVRVPRVKQSGMGWVTYTSDAEAVNLAGTKDGAFLYILTNTLKKIPPDIIASYIDLYTSATGTYYGSILIRNHNNIPCSGISKINNRLYASFNRQLVYYDSVNVQP